jgi:AraC-like DNA-binding protein
MTPQRCRQKARGPLSADASVFTFCAKAENAYFYAMPFNGRFVANLIAYAAQQGADGEALTALTGLGFEELGEEGRKLDNETYNRVLETAVAMTGDPCLGLHAGEYLNLSAAGLVLQIMQASATLRQALQYACDFANLSCSALPLALEDRGDETWITLTPDALWLEQSPLAVQHTTAGLLAFTLREFRTLTWRQPQPVAIYYAFEPPTRLAEYERVLGARLACRAPQTAIVLRQRELAQPIVTRDQGLLQALVQLAEERLTTLQHQGGFLQTVRRTMLNLARPEFPSAEMTAANLNLSLRSLQRKLQEEDTTYQALLEELKCEFAIAYLRKPSLTVSEIAYVLGYAEPSSLVRSFKRWTGKTPQRFREEQWGRDALTSAANKT